MTHWGTSCACGWSADAYDMDLVWEAFAIHDRLFFDHEVYPPYIIED